MLSINLLFISLILILSIASASWLISNQTSTLNRIEARLNSTIDEINRKNSSLEYHIIDTIQTLFHCCGKNNDSFSSLCCINNLLFQNIILKVAILLRIISMQLYLYHASQKITPSSRKAATQLYPIY